MSDKCKNCHPDFYYPGKVTWVDNVYVPCCIDCGGKINSYEPKKQQD